MQFSVLVRRARGIPSAGPPIKCPYLDFRESYDMITGLVSRHDIGSLCHWSSFFIFYLFCNFVNTLFGVVICFSSLVEALRRVSTAVAVAVVYVF